MENSAEKFPSAPVASRGSTWKVSAWPHIHCHYPYSLCSKCRGQNHSDTVLPFSMKIFKENQPSCLRFCAYQNECHRNSILSHICSFAFPALQCLSQHMMGLAVNCLDHISRSSLMEQCVPFISHTQCSWDRVKIHSNNDQDKAHTEDE